MSFSILGIGTALPELEISQTKAAELAAQICCETQHEARMLTVLFRRSGVKRRRSVMSSDDALDWLPGVAQSRADGDGRLGLTTDQRMKLFEQHSVGLARRAVQQALDNAGIRPDEITHLITVSCTGFFAPGVDIELIKGLGLSSETQRLHLGFMGCHGAINGLRAAIALAAADPRARILLCAYELCTLHYLTRWDPERMIGNVLFADGAAALVGMCGPPGPSERWQVQATGSCLLPHSVDAMTWRIGDHGFEMTLSARVPDLICEHLRPWLAAWLDRQGLSIAQIGSWAIHPGGPRIVRAVQESLSLTDEAVADSIEILAEHGNMSSPTVLFILDRLQRRGAARPCVALAFGPGLVAEAALAM